MSEVEKMYENAGVEKRCLLPNLCEHKGICKTKCVYFVCPPFTAEIQLSLIKWIIKKRYYIICRCNQNNYDFFNGNYYSINVCFENALAELVNDIWQDLTEQERTEIAEILRG